MPSLIRVAVIPSLVLATALVASDADALRLDAIIGDLAPASPTKQQELVKRVFDLTNKERSKRGLPMLTEDNALTAGALWLAKDMAKNSYLDHEDTQGRKPDARVSAFGYRNWTRVGENLAAGDTTAELVFKRWMESDKHRANLLNPFYREMGIGYAFSADSEFEHYWVQTFGSRER